MIYDSIEGNHSRRCFNNITYTLTYLHTYYGYHTLNKCTFKNDNPIREYSRFRMVVIYFTAVLLEIIFCDFDNRIYNFKNHNFSNTKNNKDKGVLCVHSLSCYILRVIIFVILIFVYTTLKITIF